MIKLTPEQWQKILGFEIIDPDGWDRSGDFQADWNKAISLNLFLDKTEVSTTTRHPSREKCHEIAQKHVSEWLAMD